jgi:hypothetical protein
MWFLLRKGDFVMLKLRVYIVISFLFKEFVVTWRLLSTPSSVCFHKEMETTKKKPQNMTEIRTERNHKSWRDLKRWVFHAATFWFSDTLKIVQENCSIQSSVNSGSVFCFSRRKRKEIVGDKTIPLDCYNRRLIEVRMTFNVVFERLKGNITRTIGGSCDQVDTILTVYVCWLFLSHEYYLQSNYTPKGKETKEDHWRDFWMCETGTG